MSERVERVTGVKLDEPPLKDIADCVRIALEKNFSKVLVEVVPCPDLRGEPWGMVARGLGGHSCLADVGGVDNLHYPENNWRTFRAEEVANAVGMPGSFVMGPGAGAPSQSGGVLTELMANWNLENGSNTTKSCKVVDSGDYLLEGYPSTEFGALANLLVCEGLPCEVIHVRASQRVGELNFVSCMRQALSQEFADACIGMAGVFEIQKGKIHAHVMPDFPGRDMLDKKTVDEWLKFYEMRSPLICLSVFITSDKPKLGFRLEHTHFFSKHGDGGHYHFDTTPGEVEYDGYYVLCEKAHRINPPIISKDRTNFWKG